jgi:peptidoglycan/LPS O-acetylase OafA/YrhL
MNLKQGSSQHQPVPIYSVHLDALRGIAALVVFFGHARDIFLTSPHVKPHIAKVGAATGAALSNATHTTTWGRQAVMVFFVLSGYLVGGGVLQRVRENRWSWSRYLFQRLTRLWIVLLPAPLAGMLIDKIGFSHFGAVNSIYFGPDGEKMISSSMAANLGWRTLLSNLLFLQTICGPVLGTNTALWSLANEFWYYIAFPLLVLGFIGRVSWAKRLVLFIALAVILIFVGKSISAYFLIWLLGAAIGRVPQVIPGKALTFVSIAALLIFLAANLLARKFNLPQRFADPLVAGCFTVLLYCILHFRKESVKSWYRSISHFIAEVSYSLYLTHIPLLVLISAILLRPWGRWPLNAHSVLYFSLICLTVFAYSALMYRLFEANTEFVRKRLAGQFFRKTTRPIPVSLVAAPAAAENE